MGYQLKDRLELSIFIGDAEFPLEALNTLSGLHMAASTKFRLPTCHFVLTDTMNVMRDIRLQDGIPLRIVIKNQGNDTHFYRFRLFNYKRTWNGSAYTYDIDGYWDSVLYWAGTATNGIQATSSGALAEIARMSGLGYDGVSTSDNQLWMQRNMIYAEFAKFVAAHGFVNNESYMVHGVNLQGMLKYRNANKMPKTEYKIVAYTGEPGSYLAMDYQPVAASGLPNAILGYWNSRVSQSLVNKPFVDDRLVFRSDSRDPLFNTRVKELAKRGSIAFSPIDVGNVHSDYSRAQYQNSRYAGLFNQDTAFLLNTFSKLDILDTFNFSAVHNQELVDQSMSGNYTVTGKIIYIEGATYAEKIIGTRHGLNQTLGG